MGGGGGSKTQGGDKASNMSQASSTDMQQLPPAPKMSPLNTSATQAPTIPAPAPAAGLTRPERIAQARAFPNIEVRDPDPIKSLAPSLEYDPALQQMNYFDGQMGYKYEARNQVVGDHAPIELGFKTDKANPQPGIRSRAYGPGYSYIDTGRPDGKDIHGGGTGCEDPFAPNQEWRPTHGCIRMQNKDVRDLSKRIESYQSDPGKFIPFEFKKR